MISVKSDSVLSGRSWGTKSDRLTSRSWDLGCQSIWICLPATAETCFNKQKYWLWINLANQQFFSLFYLWISIGVLCLLALQKLQFWYPNTLLKDVPFCSKCRNYPQSTHRKAASRSLTINVYYIKDHKNQHNRLKLPGYLSSLDIGMILRKKFVNYLFTNKITWNLKTHLDNKCVNIVITWLSETCNAYAYLREFICLNRLKLKIINCIYYNLCRFCKAFWLK